MKKMVLFILVVVIATAVLSCGKSEDELKKEEVLELIDEDEMEIVEEAIELLEERWEEIYKENREKIDWDYREYLEIKNVKLIEIERVNERAEKYFGNVKYIVEFDVNENYYGRTEEYYTNLRYADNVVFYEDGTSEVTMSVFSVYFGATYDFPFEHIDLNVTDLGSLYNEVLIDRPKGE